MSASPTSCTPTRLSSQDRLRTFALCGMCRLTIITTGVGTSSASSPSPSPIASGPGTAKTCCPTGRRSATDPTVISRIPIPGPWAPTSSFDTFATEGQGAVQDRTSEHLGYTDRAITALRRLLLRAVRSVQEGSNPPHRLLDSDDPDMTHIVSSVEVVPIDEWRDAWKIRSAEMREFLDAAQR